MKVVIDDGQRFSVAVPTDVSDIERKLVFVQQARRAPRIVRGPVSWAETKYRSELHKAISERPAQVLVIMPSTARKNPVLWILGVHDSVVT
jgi:hypothetical protein